MNNGVIFYIIRNLMLIINYIIYLFVKIVKGFGVVSLVDIEFGVLLGVF